MNMVAGMYDDVAAQNLEELREGMPDGEITLQRIDVDTNR